MSSAPRSPRLRRVATAGAAAGAAAVVVAGTAFVGTHGLASTPAPSGIDSSPVRAADDPDPVLVAAGDISTRTQDGGNQMTSDLVLSLHPDAVVTMGDNQYPDGDYGDFQRYYDPTWGRFKSITHPAPGHHEYKSDDGASGYFRYFGAAATPRNPDCTSGCSGYYSWNLGDWHLIALNTNGDDHGNACTFVACGASSAQVAWLKQDLADNDKPCVAAYFADPRWSSGKKHGSNPDLDGIWDALYAGGADVVLNGHEHIYERFAKQDPSGHATDGGIRQFSIGTGGNGNLYEVDDALPNSQVHENNARGVLKMTLHNGSYSWSFEAAEKTFSDSGSDTCSSS